MARAGGKSRASRGRRERIPSTRLASRAGNPGVRRVLRGRYQSRGISM